MTLGRRMKEEGDKEDDEGAWMWRTEGMLGDKAEREILLSAGLKA